MIKKIFYSLFTLIFSFQPIFCQKSTPIFEFDPYQTYPKPMKASGKYGYVNEKNEIKIALIYDEADSFQNGVAVVKIKNKVALINEKEEIIVPFGKYDVIHIFQEKLAKVVKNNKCGFIDPEGKEVIACKYDDADFFRNSLAEVKLNHKFGLINKQGAEVLPIQYEELIMVFRVIKAKFNEKWGFIDLEGKVSPVFIYDEIGNSLSENCWVVKKDNKYGFVNSRGQVVIECKYEEASPFSNGKAVIKLNGKLGTVDKKGNEKMIDEY